MVNIRHAKLQAVAYDSDSSDNIILQILLLVLHLQCVNVNGFWRKGGGGRFDRFRLAPRQFLVCVCVKSAVKCEEKKLWGEGVCVWAPWEQELCQGVVIISSAASTGSDAGSLGTCWLGQQDVVLQCSTQHIAQRPHEHCWLSKVGGCLLMRVTK